MYTTQRGLRALRRGVNMVDTTFASPCYWRRLEKYAERGFAVAVPGFLPERVSKEILQASYVFITQYELLLKAGACETAKDKEVVFQGDPFASPRMDTVKVNARTCQHATSVRGLARLIVFDRGLARVVNTPQRWLCERHSKIVCESTMLTGACVPISKGCSGEYLLLWGVHEPVPKDVTDGKAAAECDGGDQYYDTTPLANIYAVLDKASRQDALADPTPDDGWWRGGVMQRIASTMKRDTLEATKVALETHVARASTGNPLHFVWDMVSTDAKFGCLKYVLDAARPPLCDRPDFEKVNGLPRRLRFEARKKRTPTEMDVFEGVY